MKKERLPGKELKTTPAKPFGMERYFLMDPVVLDISLMLPGATKERIR